MLLYNQKKICIKRTLEQRWRKKTIHLVYTSKLILSETAFLKVPLEIILLVHVQREKFTFTIVHSVSNISLEAYSYLKLRKKIVRVLKVQLYFIFHFRDSQLWYKMVSWHEILKTWKSGWPGLLSPVALYPSPIDCVAENHFCTLLEKVPLCNILI